MAIVYPGNPPGSSQDVFSVPSEPESTPLSEAGAGNTRDHPQLHADIGAALEAVESWATLRTHDHSGDGSSVATGTKLDQDNTHQNADTDSSVGAIHHTLYQGLPATPVVPGSLPNPSYQAAPGNHTHLYSTLIGTPLQICTTTSRPTSPVLGQMIYETDTNTLRVWAGFANNVMTPGVYSADYFTVADSTGMNPSNWTQTYQLPSPGAGTMEVAAPGDLAWSPGVSNWSNTGGATSNRCLALRTNPGDSSTLTDDQVITWATGTQVIQNQPQSYSSAVQMVSITGSPTGGTFTLGYGGVWSVPIPFNASAGVVRSALAGISTIGSLNNISVTGNNGGPWTVGFGPALTASGTLNGDIASFFGLSVDGLGLTGGFLPVVALSDVYAPPAGLVDPANDVYLRCSASLQSYIRVSVQYQSVYVYYTTSGWANEIQLGVFGNTLFDNNIDTAFQNGLWTATVSGRTLTLTVNGALVGSLTDSANVTMMGPSNRGWGIGMTAGNSWLMGNLGWILGETQMLPANVNWVSISDAIFYTTQARWSLLSAASRPSVRLAQTAPQKFYATGTLVAWQKELEDNFGFFSPSAPTSILCGEPGLYAVNAQVAWDDALFPDVAVVSVLVNNQITNLVTQQFLQANALTPGYSQTVNVSGKLRLALNDVVSLQAGFNPSNQFINGLLSFFDINNAVVSWFEMTYLSP